MAVPNWRVVAVLSAFALTLVFLLVPNAGRAPACRPPADPANGPIFHVVAKESSTLGTVIREARRRGMQDSGLPQSPESVRWGAWDLLWTMHHPPMLQLPSPLRQEQRVNHIPGNSAVASKVRLWQLHRDRLADQRLMPRHYIMPEDLSALRSAVAEAPEQRYVVKNRRHRGVEILTDPVAAAIDLVGEGETGSRMISEYVEPLLIDGHKFDVGLYVLVPSVAPLRVYIYENALMRFCKRPYPEDGVITADTPTDAYVVVDYLPPWELPALKPLYGSGGVPSGEAQGTNTLEVLMAHLDAAGFSGLEAKRTMHDTIVQTLRAAAPAMGEATAEVTSHPSVFFELWRCDFALDAQGRPWLLEMNMSPNLVPKRFASGNDAALKRGVVDSVLELVNAGAPPVAPVEGSAELCEAACPVSDCAPGNQVCWACGYCPFAAWGPQMRAVTHEYQRRGGFELAFPTPSSASPEEEAAEGDGAAAAVAAALAAAVQSGRRRPREAAPVPPRDAPDPEPVTLDCTDRAGCSGQGNCVNGRCMCEGPFHGPHCEKRGASGVRTAQPVSATPVAEYTPPPPVSRPSGGLVLVPVVAIPVLGAFYLLKFYYPELTGPQHRE